jgi:hypothetical protein
MSIHVQPQPVTPCGPPSSPWNPTDQQPHVWPGRPAWAGRPTPGARLRQSETARDRDWPGGAPGDHGGWAWAGRCSPGARRRPSCPACPRGPGGRRYGPAPSCLLAHPPRHHGGKSRPCVLARRPGRWRPGARPPGQSPGGGCWHANRRGHHSGHCTHVASSHPRRGRAVRMPAGKGQLPPKRQRNPGLSWGPPRVSCH